MRRTRGGTDRPSAAAARPCTSAGCLSSGGTTDAETAATTARRPALRPSSRRNGATVRTASQAGPAVGVSSAIVVWAMASTQFMVSDDVSHQARHSALMAGSPVSVRTTRNAVMEAIACPADVEATTMPESRPSESPVEAPDCPALCSARGFFPRTAKFLWCGPICRSNCSCRSGRCHSHSDSWSSSTCEPPLTADPMSAFKRITHAGRRHYTGCNAAVSLALNRWDVQRTGREASFARNLY
jgi:hypothetical protein